MCLSFVVLLGGLRTSPPASKRLVAYVPLKLAPVRVLSIPLPLRQSCGAVSSLSWISDGRCPVFGCSSPWPARRCASVKCEQSAWRTESDRRRNSISTARRRRSTSATAARRRPMPSTCRSAFPARGRARPARAATTSRPTDLRSARAVSTVRRTRCVWCAARRARPASVRWPCGTARAAHGAERPPTRSSAVSRTTSWPCGGTRQSRRTSPAAVRPTTSRVPGAITARHRAPSPSRAQADITAERARCRHSAVRCWPPVPARAARRVGMPWAWYLTWSLSSSFCWCCGCTTIDTTYSTTSNRTATGTLAAALSSGGRNGALAITV